MRKIFPLILTIVSSAQVLAAAPTPEVALSRIDCGRFEQLPMAVYDDVAMYGTHRDAVSGAHRDAVNPCYVIRHGSEFMLWDTGLSVGVSLWGGALIGPKRSMKDVLAEHDIKPGQIKIIGVSHNHFDHLGQAADFPHAKLIIGAEDWINIKNLPGSKALHAYLPERTAVQPWLDNEENVIPIVDDRDIFGDGSVVMLNTPGHTPGHHSLLVRLKDRGPIFLTGDLYEWQQNFETDAVPNNYTNRADQLASYDRFKKIARKLRGIVIIQHEPADLAKLPAFPEWAK